MIENEKVYSGTLYSLYIILYYKGKNGELPFEVGWRGIL